MAHALLSPSSIERWMRCTPSARLEQGVRDGGSPYAQEGTYAHSWGELLILRELKILSKYVFEEEQAKLRAEVVAFYTTLKEPDPEAKALEMLAWVEGYRDYVIEAYNAAKATDPGARIFTEVKLNTGRWIREGFGTGDIVIVANGIAHLIDLKYGQGVPVDAYENGQLKAYGLGVLEAYYLEYGIQLLKLTIYQPRLHNVSTFEISADELLQWGANTLRPAAELAYAGQGDFSPGEKQCRFCKVKGKCKALADHNLALAQQAFEPVEFMTPEQVSYTLDNAALFTSWLTAVKEHALSSALKGEQRYPGYKVVEGRSDRKYTDPEKVAQILTEKGYSRDDIMQPAKLKGITAMTGLLTTKGFNTLLKDYIVKPSGAPTLAPLSDKRPEYKGKPDADTAFAGVELTED